jgi:arginyl-tRNA--protein-N-Asp/Glu arginylyltransferase
MKYIFKEYKTNYENYEYPYQIYLEANENDSIDEIYEKGFLATRIKKNYYYLTRNLRINLQEFSLNSENRRILKKTESLTLENKKLNDFTFNYSISKLATDFFKTKFNKTIITPQKLKWLFAGEFFTNVLVYKNKNEIIGYCITMETKKTLHYAYPFYKSELIGTNIGMSMMIQAIEHAKEKNKKYVYLGTVYTKDSMYKLQFKGIQWFNGESWNDDIDKLKSLINEN